MDLGQSVRGKWRNIYTFIVSQTGEKSRDDALEAIKGNLDGFSRDAKMHPTPASHPKKPGSLNFNFILMEDYWSPCVFNWLVYVCGEWVLNCVCVWRVSVEFFLQAKYRFRCFKIYSALRTMV